MYPSPPPPVKYENITECIKIYSALPNVAFNSTFYCKFCTSCMGCIYKQIKHKLEFAKIL